MDLTIIIVSWNTRSLLDGCIESLAIELKNSPHISCEVIVVDNASTDGSGEMVRAYFPWVKLVENSRNFGFASANNQGEALAEGRYLLLLNPDTILHPGLLSSLFTFLESTSDAGAVGPRVCNLDGTLQESAYLRPTLMREFWRLFHLDQLWSLSRYSPAFFRSDAPKKVDILKGACMLIRREVIHSIGLFDEQFFVYSEEFDLCMRMQSAGWKVYWLPSATILHLGGQSTSQVSENMFLELYKNKIRLFRKHYGSFQAQCYKVLIWLAAVTRIIGARLNDFITKNHPYRKEIAHRYRVLITELAKM